MSTNEEQTTTIKHPNNFIDPYEHIPREKKSRTTIDVAVETRAEISAIYPKKGYLQTTINILLEKLRKELRKNGLNSYAPDEFKYAVGNCTITLGGVDRVDSTSLPRTTSRKRTTKSKSHPANEVSS
jgi:hypothetical protein